MNISQYPVSKKASGNGKDLIKGAAKLEASSKPVTVAKARELELIAAGHKVVAASLAYGGGPDLSYDLFWDNKEWTRNQGVTNG